MPRPKNADSAATFDSIVRAGLELLYETDDVKALSLRKAAARAGVSHGTIQYYFSNKEELLEACLDAYYSRLAEFGQELIQYVNQTADDSAAIIEELVRRSWRFVRSERTMMRLRLVTNATRGELHPDRQPHFLGSLVRAAAKTIAPHTPLGLVEAGLVVQSMSMLLVRFAIFSDSEVLHLTGESGVAGEKRVEDFLIRSAKRMLELRS